MNKLRKNELEMLWGNGEPYSEAKIILETRILGDSVSREVAEVRGNINPTTFKIVKKKRKEFTGDEIVLQLIDSARYMNKHYGYEISGGAYELSGDDKELMKHVYEQLEYTKQAIIRMHKFVMKNLP